MADTTPQTESTTPATPKAAKKASQDYKALAASSQLDVRFNNSFKYFKRVNRMHVYKTIKQAAARVLVGKADGLDLHALMLGTAGFVALTTDVLPAIGPNLRELKISSNYITWAGVEALVDRVLLEGSMRNLTTLDVHGNEIGDRGAMRLADGVFYGCPKIEALNLSFNRIGRMGASHLQRMLVRHPTLSQVQLRANGLGAADIAREGAPRRHFATGPYPIGNHRSQVSGLWLHPYMSGGRVKISQREAVRLPSKSALDTMKNIPEVPKGKPVRIFTPEDDRVFNTVAFSLEQESYGLILNERAKDDNRVVTV